MKLVWTYSLSLLVFFLSSCDGNTDYRYYVHNLSDNEVSVKFKRIKLDSLITIPVLPGFRALILTESKLGGTTDPYEISLYIDSLDLSGSVGDYQKDPMNTKTWDVSSERLRRIPAMYEHDYVLVVRNQDFE